MSKKEWKPRAVQEPVEVTRPNERHEDEHSYEHPAFAQIQANRVQGTTTLYDSDFIHDRYISIRIHRSQLNRNLARDWHFAREQYVEVKLSEAQWATFVSSLNTGGGVPCTLYYLAGKEIPELPYRNERAAIEGDLKEKLDKMQREMAAAILAVEGELGTSVSQKKKDAVLSRLRQVQRTVGDSLPFMAKSFDEHMEKTIERAKTEVHGYVNSVIARAGLDAIAAGGQVPLYLPGKDDTVVDAEIVEQPETGE